MSDELLPYYNRELRFIRQQGAEFAAAHPKIAGRLNLGPETADDPHVARLIEAFAYLNARTRFKLEDDFPEITEAFLNVLYPHFLAPVPSMSIAKFALDPGQAELTDGYSIELHTPLETQSIEGEPCRFRTCYPVTLWPLEVASVALERRPFQAPKLNKSSRPDVLPRAVLRVQLRSLSSKVPIGSCSLERLRFFINGQAPDVYDLYELLLLNTVDVAVATSLTDQAPVALPASALQPVGFGRDEGMLEYGARSFPGYRLLTEFFAFREKFLFLDVHLPRRAVERMGETMELILYLKEGDTDLERSVDEDTLMLGCTPIVNLYRQAAESIALTHTESEYRVTPDWRRPLAHEVYSINDVVATTSDGESTRFDPFYSYRHGRLGREKTFWYATRRPAPERPKEPDRGTEMFLSLVDLDFHTAHSGKWTVTAETTCLNRDLPRRLPFGGGQPQLQVSGGAPPIAAIRCLVRPTPTLRPTMGHGTRWRLISHLTLNHLSLVDYPGEQEDQEGAHALREILKLYDFAASAESGDMIAGVLSVSSRRVTGRIKQRVDGKTSTFLCRGLEVTLEFDEDKFTGGGMFLLASVLERFLGLYCSINSFVKTIVSTKQRGVIHEWPPRAGERALL